MFWSAQFLVIIKYWEKSIDQMKSIIWESDLILNFQLIDFRFSILLNFCATVSNLTFFKHFGAFFQLVSPCRCHRGVFFNISAIYFPFPPFFLLFLFHFFFQLFLAFILFLSCHSLRTLFFPFASFYFLFQNFCALNCLDFCIFPIFNSLLFLNFFEV